MHLTVQHYLRVLRGDLPLPALVHHTASHLARVCPVCAAALRHADAAIARPAPRPAALTAPLTDPRHLTRRAVAEARQRLSLLRAIATEARQDLRRLIRLPQDAWRDRVAAARTRMRSRTFAELLLDESRARVRNEPRTAAVLAGLVPLALRWTEGRRDLPWLAPLLARATAHRANALRVAGDLPAADGLFRDLAATTAASAWTDPVATAEIASLEASLCIDQRRFDDAERRLDLAIDAYNRAAHPVGVARALIQRANLMQTVARPEAVVPLLDRAAGLLGPATDPYLLGVTVTGRVNALCDLDRAAEAEPLLDEHRTLYLDAGEGYTVAIFTLLSGRVALGLGRLADAEARLADARDRLLALDRDYDATVTSLYLADALLAAGKTAELKRLAAGLVPLFRARDVAREVLAALRLFAEAAKTEHVTAAVLSEARRRLHERSAP